MFYLILHIFLILFRFYDLVMVLTEGDLDLNLDNAEAGPIQFE